MKRLAVALACSMAACNGAAVPGPDGGAPPADLAAARDLTGMEPADLSMPADLAVPSDLAAGPRDLAGDPFSSRLEGIWMIGWSGGLDHYSWFKFTVTDPWGVGKFSILEPERGGSFIGLYPDCTGAGDWMITAKPNTIQLNMPAPCNLPMQVMTFERFGPPMMWPPGAILDARVTLLTQQDLPLDGWKFPPDRCDPGFTTCRLPR